MTVSLTTRLGLTRWSDDNDAWSRAQFTANVDALESQVALATVGTISARPSASTAANQRRLYFSSDERLLYFGTGSAWEALPVLGNTAQQNFAGVVTSTNNQVTTRNDAAAGAPSTGTYARGDKVWATTPVASGFIGFVCVTAGTPGTWKTFGPISA